MSVTLNYQTTGAGEPVVILHGLFGSSRNWASFAKKLAVNYQVINIDLRNHGNSDHTETMTYPEMANDVANVLKACGLKQASILGHSLGGKVAMTFALQNRAMIDKLIVLDIAPASYRNDLLPILEAMANLPLEQVSSRNQADVLLAKNIVESSLRQFLLQNLVQNGNNYHWRINLDSIRKSLIDLSGFPAPVSIKSYQGQALFLAGSDSDYIQPQHHPIIKQYFSKAQIHTIKDAGHWLHIDQPGKTLERIESFLNSNHSNEPPSLLYRR